MNSQQPKNLRRGWSTPDPSPCWISRGSGSSSKVATLQSISEDVFNNPHDNERITFDYMQALETTSCHLPTLGATCGERSRTPSPPLLFERMYQSQTANSQASTPLQIRAAIGPLRMGSMESPSLSVTPSEAALDQTTEMLEEASKRLSFGSLEAEENIYDLPNREDPKFNFSFSSTDDPPCFRSRYNELRRASDFSMDDILGGDRSNGVGDMNDFSIHMRDVFGDLMFNEIGSPSDPSTLRFAQPPASPSTMTQVVGNSKA